jgi:hypothetical protein
MMLALAEHFPLERRRSWYERYAANKMKADKSISDEDMKKVIGMDRAELAEWSKDKPVGPRQESLYAGNVGYLSGRDGGRDMWRALCSCYRTAAFPRKANGANMLK